MSKSITGLLKTRAEADAALASLERAGFDQSRVSLIVGTEGMGKHFEAVKVGDDKMDDGAITGATLGGLAGALYMGLASAGTLIIPGLNLVVAGTLVGVLAGLGGGAAAGGLAGALIGAGISEDEAEVFEENLREGDILIVAEARNKDEEAAINSILKKANAHGIKALAA